MALVYEFRFSQRFAAVRILISLATALLTALPGVLALRVLAGPAVFDAVGPVTAEFAIAVPIWAILSRKHWRNLFDRTPQLELFTGFLRARQHPGRDIPWARVEGLRCSEPAERLDPTDGWVLPWELGTSAEAYVVLDLDGGERFEFDVLGWDADPERISQAIAMMALNRKVA